MFKTMPTFDKIFRNLFPWWKGSEGQFLNIITMIHKLESNDDWIISFYHFRIIAHALKLVPNSASLINDIVEIASNNRYLLWLEPYARAYHREKISDELTTYEKSFLVEMTKIERENMKKRNFTELWFNWQEVKMSCIRSFHNSWLDTFGFQEYRIPVRQWDIIQRKTVSFRRNFNFDKS